MAAGVTWISNLLLTCLASFLSVVLGVSSSNYRIKVMTSVDSFDFAPRQLVEALGWSLRASSTMRRTCWSDMPNNLATSICFFLFSKISLLISFLTLPLIGW
jgi:hypothetical protein